MKLNKDFEFSLKVMVLIVLIAFLAFDFVLQVYSPKKNLEGIPVIERIDIYYAFFTTQSNYAVVLYLIVALFMRRIYNTKPAFGIELAMTVYITVTMLVFWFGLLASPDELKAYYPSNWVSTVVLHMCIPSIMIGYFMLSCGDQYYSTRRHSKFSLPLTCGYPIGYLMFAMIRGEIRFNYYSPEFFTNIYSVEDKSQSWFWQNLWSEGNGVINNDQHFTQQMWYPYWFLNVHQFKLEANGEVYSKSFGPEWMVISIFILAVMAITLLVVGLQFFYLNWNNGKFYRWHDIEGKLITKEEHDYRKQRAKLKKITIKNQAKMELLHKKTDYKIFLKSIKSLPKDQRLIKKAAHLKAKSLEEKLKRASIKQEKVIIKSNKGQIKRFILSLNYKDRPFVKENLREAERYKKLVKQGVLIFRPKYVD
ncbi:Pr6Pr family membrane protein [Spiroplasma sp. BIUS-1]|uniref:Pr6Pr family membrane protein n=1 Tax=Spiroplasma sp. BIUS-1 TaxID=216964 RepID=UPI0013992C1A|nr:Pr6Pr family membrane protein [Spiroplasma sp. BIUS-1]QHX36971.1 hypothetical protein SBIUS_v1c07180 [Spiroplasma sp. BIUS-1]